MPPLSAGAAESLRWLNDASRMRPPVPRLPAGDVVWVLFAAFTIITSWRYFGKKQEKSQS